jgi:hypothetical protein
MHIECVNLALASNCVQGKFKSRHIFLRWIGAYVYMPVLFGWFMRIFRKFIGNAHVYLNSVRVIESLYLILFITLCVNSQLVHVLCMRLRSIEC